MSPLRTEMRAAALTRILSGYNKEEGEEKGEREINLVTLNLLGGGPIRVGYRDLDLDFRVSLSGLENRCDLLSDKMQPQKPSPPAPARRELQDLNLPPAPEAAGNCDDAPPLEDSASLDLHTVTSAASRYPSICTLENVKSALVRAERESRDKARQEGRTDVSPSSSLSSAATNSSMKRRRVDEGGGSEDGAADGSDSSGGPLMAAGCPNCLLYVLVAKRDPRCPRCGSHVPVPAFYKKPKVHF